MEWRHRLAEVADAARALRDGGGSARRATLARLGALVSCEDAAVGFAAARALAAAADAEIASAALGAAGDPHGLKLALLRQLVAGPSGNERGDGLQDEARQAIGSLAALLGQIDGVEERVRAAFADCEPGREEPRQVEALGLLCDILKCVAGQLGDSTKHSSAVAVCGLAARVIEHASVPLGLSAVPSSIRCAVLDVMEEWCKLARDLNVLDCRGGRARYEDYCRVGIQCIAEPSCVSFVLKLINSSEANSAKAVQEAFISSNSAYPFLQKWLLAAARLAAAIVDTEYDWKSVPMPNALPSRRKVLTILSEQDDVMVEVVYTITYSIMKMMQKPGNRHPDFERIATELDPDLLFADLLVTFAFDHLVLLDFLTSSETVMLEFVLRYLRWLRARWETSSEVLKTAGQLDQVLGTLIRLRFEIIRLTTAGLFPYDAKPLVRRIEAVEGLYEGGSHV